MFEELKKISIKLGKVPNTLDFQRESNTALKTYSRRFGKWSNVLLSFKNWLEVNNIEFPYKDRLPSVPETSMKIKESCDERVSQHKSEWKSVKSSQYGPILNFRGLQHAPINEQGVVYLFGMVSSELGFIIEAIRTDYPDCEGKRLVSRKKGSIYERVTIEFEYKSSSFKEHGHDPSKCDLIVCWEHDWNNCPI